MKQEELNEYISMPGRYLIYTLPDGEFIVLPLGHKEILISPEANEQCMAKFAISESPTDLQ